MGEDQTPKSEIVLYQSEDGKTRIQCRFENETIWLTQALIAELFQKDVRTINEHLVNIYDEQELAREATLRKFRIVRIEGVRQVAREIDHYSLPAILAVGYRVRSPRGTQFHQWATARLSEYLVKDFTLRGLSKYCPYRGKRIISRVVEKGGCVLHYGYALLEGSSNVPKNLAAISGRVWLRWSWAAVVPPSLGKSPSSQERSGVISSEEDCTSVGTVRSGKDWGGFVPQDNLDRLKN